MSALFQDHVHDWSCLYYVSELKNITNYNVRWKTERGTDPFTDPTAIYQTSQNSSSDMLATMTNKTSQFHGTLRAQARGCTYHL